MDRMTQMIDDERGYGGFDRMRESFLEYLRVNDGLSPNTVKSYGEDTAEICMFSNFVASPTSTMSA
jgi:site-specific recombinase XerD